MQGIPEDFDFNFLVGCYLETVCFGISTITLNFSRPQKSIGVEPYKVSISIWAGLSYQSNNTYGVCDYNDWVSCCPVLNFLLYDVDFVSLIDESTINIIFDKENKITISGDYSDGYESYSISLDSGEIIVI
jgi:hypothetical protein